MKWTILNFEKKSIISINHYEIMGKYLISSLSCTYILSASHDASRLISVFSQWRKEGSMVSRGIFNDLNFKMQLIQGKFRWALWVWPTWLAETPESTFNGYCLVPSPLPTLLPTGVVNWGSGLVLFVPRLPQQRCLNAWMIRGISGTGTSVKSENCQILFKFFQIIE